MQYTKNYKQNLELYWQQHFPGWKVPTGYHVHHINPVCTFENRDDPRINHPRNLIALHPDDHQTIHRCRGDIALANGFLSIKDRRHSTKSIEKMKHVKSNLSSDIRENMAKGQRNRTIYHAHSSETKRKISIANKGRASKFKGVARSTEVKQKIGLANSKQKRSDSEKHHLSLLNKGRKFYNNGITGKYYFPGEEPAGWELGKIKHES